MNGCPDRQTIHRWLECDLPADQFASAGNHIEQCEHCREVALSAPGLADAAARLNQWLRSGVLRTEECLSYAELVGYTEGTLGADAHERVRSHVMTCADCGADLRSLQGFRASRSQRKPKQFSPAPDARGAAGSSASGLPKRRWIGRLVPAFGVIAVVVIAVITYGFLRGGEESLLLRIPEMRGGEGRDFDITFPDRKIIHSRQPTFRWTEYESADRVVYDLELTEVVEPSPECPDGHKPVEALRGVTETSARLKHRLQPGHVYLITVYAVLDSAGERRIRDRSFKYFAVD